MLDTFYVNVCFAYAREPRGKSRRGWYNCTRLHNKGRKWQELNLTIDDCSETFISNLYNIHARGGFNLSQQGCGETRRCNNLPTGRVYVELHYSHRVDIPASLLEYQQPSHQREQSNGMNVQMAAVS